MSRCLYGAGFLAPVGILRKHGKHKKTVTRQPCWRQACKAAYQRITIWFTEGLRLPVSRLQRTLVTLVSSLRRERLFGASSRSSCCVTTSARRSARNRDRTTEGTDPRPCKIKTKLVGRRSKVEAQTNSAAKMCEHFLRNSGMGCGRISLTFLHRTRQLRVRSTPCSKVKPQNSTKICCRDWCWGTGCFCANPMTARLCTAAPRVLTPQKTPVLNRKAVLFNTG